MPPRPKKTPAQLDAEIEAAIAQVVPVGDAAHLHREFLTKQIAGRTPKITTSNIKLAAANPKTHKLVCCYCGGGHVARNSYDVDGDAAHKTCHDEASR